MAHPLPRRVGHHVGVVQVAVHDDRRRGVRQQRATEGQRLLDVAPRDRHVAPECVEVAQPPLDVRLHARQLRQRGDVEPTVEAADHLAGLDVPGVGEVGAGQPRQEHGAPARVGAQEAYGARAAPVLQRQRLVERLVVAVEGDLEGARRAVGVGDREDQGAVAVQRSGARRESPLRHELLGQARQAIQPARPVLPQLPLGQQSCGNGERHAASLGRCPATSPAGSRRWRSWRGTGPAPS